LGYFINGCQVQQYVWFETGALKMRERKMRDWKTWHGETWVENVGLENAGMKKYGKLNVT